MSNDLPPSLGKFKGELEQAIKRQLELAPATSRPWRRRPRVLAGTSLGLAAIATTLALVLTAASSPPAFAVTRHHDGTVSVKLMRLSGVAGANARLKTLHINVRLVQVAARCPAPTAPPPPPPGRYRPQVSIKPWQIPAGRTLVLGVRQDGRTATWSVVGAVPVGAVPNCLPPPPPQCLRHKGRFMNRPLPGSVSRSRRRSPHQVPLSCKPTPRH